MASRYFICITLLFCFFALSKGDTPANCTYGDSLGTWVLHLGVDGKTRKVDCSKNFQITNNYTVHLLFPDKAVDAHGNVGFWTMVYNQGFEIVLAGRKYFAFSKYVKKGSKVTSMCDQTLHGWAHNADDSNWQCYYATKMHPSGTEVRTHDLREQIVLQEFQKTRKYRSNKDFINKINNAQDLWTAAEYPEYEDYTLAELNIRAGRPTVPKAFAGPRFRMKRDRLRRNSDELIYFPKQFDWRNVSNVNYVSPVRNQGGCGSCYAFSSMAMYEARLRVATKNTIKRVMSPQDVVSCSEYAQGCAGGFPYLVAGKYGEDFGLVEESCFPYDGKDEPCKETKSKCSRHYTTKYYYVGGFYGACNEYLMMRELVQNGPISVSFEVYSDFHHYKGGIYRHTGFEDSYNPWQITNHAVLLVGYGTDQKSGKDYWIVKNSW